MSTALDTLTAEQVEAAARALYARRVERGYPRNLSIPAPWWHQLTDRERERFRDDVLTVAARLAAVEALSWELPPADMRAALAAPTDTTKEN